MARERPPKFVSLAPDMIKSHRPTGHEVSAWHTVTSGRQENFGTIAAKYRLPVDRIIEFNFPESVENGRLIPEIVNWYLHYHKDFGCPDTPDGRNRIFRGGERIAIPHRSNAVRLPTLAEAEKWFEGTVIWRRTATSGFSANRLWKSPQGMYRGNVPDPNGLCGDTSMFVSGEYFRLHTSFATSDGYHMGWIFWEGEKWEQNHIANVMLRQPKIHHETYRYDPLIRKTVSTSTTAQYDTTSLFKLRVFDLYYKKTQDLQSWWRDRNTGFGGKLEIGQQQDF